MSDPIAYLEPDAKYPMCCYKDEIDDEVKDAWIPLYTAPTIPEVWPECEEFYNLMQAYRHAPMNDQAAVVAAYEAVKDWLTKQGETA